VLLLKRFLAALLDLIFFLGLIFSIDLISKRFGFWLGREDLPLPFILSFISCFIFSILFFSCTVGEKLLRIRYVSHGGSLLRIGLILKYFLLYSLFTLDISNFISFFGGVLDIYTYLHIPDLLVFRLNVAFIITNWIVLLISMGRYSVLDRVMGLRVDHGRPNYRRLTPLFIACVFIALVIFSMGVERKLRDMFNFERTARSVEMTGNEIRFPPEEFDRYTMPGQIHYRIERTNFIVTNSDINSFVFDEFLYQRQIDAQIQGDLLHDPRKREELCYKLINYCYRIIDLQDTNALVMQTKIELAHMEYYAPYVAVVSYFIYYFDDKAPNRGIYGGYNADSMNVYYRQTKRNCTDTLCKFLARRTGLSFNEILQLNAKGDWAAFYNGLPSEIRNEYESIDLESQIDKRLAAMHQIPFDSVRRTGNIVAAYPTAKYPIFGDAFYPTQFIGVMRFKNDLFRKADGKK
jgi:hypothetical protein